MFIKHSNLHLLGMEPYLWNSKFQENVSLMVLLISCPLSFKLSQKFINSPIESVFCLFIVILKYSDWCLTVTFNLLN